MRKRIPLADRFWAKVQKTDGCWLWTGAKLPTGYGVIQIRPRGVQYAHRVALELSGVEIPDGMYACHHCDNPSCVRPSHLFVGSHADNMADAKAKGRLTFWNSQKTECAHGHPFTPENTSYHERYGRPRRTCLACRRRRNRAFAERRRVA